VLEKRCVLKQTSSCLDIKGCVECCFPTGWPMSHQRHTVSRRSSDSESLRVSLISAAHGLLVVRSLATSDTRHTSPPTPVSASTVNLVRSMTHKPENKRNKSARQFLVPKTHVCRKQCRELQQDYLQPITNRK